jgi:hypothetical protein
MHPERAARRTVLALALAVFAAPPVRAAEKEPVPIPPDHYTKAELTSFKATPSYEETVAFLLRLTKTSPVLHLDWIGASGEGRRMPLVVVSKEKAFTPEEAWKTGKPVVLVLNSIHGGEVDGTDASLILLRDIALTNRPDILDAVTLLVVPIYNLDGHERVSRYNRPNQDGPIEGMGFRTNARGLDLNRDWLKADAPETRAVLAAANAWKPDVFVDDHVSDGSDHQATFTLTYASEPHTPKPLAEWLSKVIPRTLREVEEAGFKTSPYVEWIDAKDPLKGIDDGAAPPRYSTGYFPLRNVAAILVETHAIKPYAQRVRANAAFLGALLPRVGRESKALLAARDAARADARHAAVGTPFVLDGETDLSRPETIDFPGYAWTEVVSPVMGRPVLRFDPTRPLLMKMPVFFHAKPTVTVSRPAGYVVPAGWPEIEERLKAHGIRYRKLETPATLDVGTFRAEDATFSPQPYQGLTRVTAKIRRAVEKRAIPAGSLWVPLDGEMSRVVMHLLEPEGPDSLFQWGKLSTCLEQKEWIDPRVLDPLAEKMLAEDPKLKAEWEERLKDPKFEKDARARHRFFYEKTPYWDETVGLVPVYRLEKPLPEPPAKGAAD